jgi:Na+/proline symporter
MPVGMKGLLIAGVLSAAISSLDSILAALSQISMTMFYRPFIKSDGTEAHYLSMSRFLVVIWGALLGVTAWQFSQSTGDLITLAFSMTTYTLGPMLGLFILSLLSARYRVSNITPAVCVSVLVVLAVNEPELFTGVIEHSFTSPLLAWPWLFPIGTLVCVGLAIRAPLKPTQPKIAGNGDDHRPK